MCVIQNMGSFTSQALPHFASTLRASSVKQAGSRQLEQATFKREAKSETIHCKKKKRKKKVQKGTLSQILKLNNVSGSKLLLEALLFRCRNDVISVRRQFVSPGGLCAGSGECGGCTVQIAPGLRCNTDAVL